MRAIVRGRLTSHADPAEAVGVVPVVWEQGEDGEVSGRARGGERARGGRTPELSVRVPAAAEDQILELRRGKPSRGHQS